MRFALEIEYDMEPDDDPQHVLFALCDNVMDHPDVSAVSGYGKGAVVKLPLDSGPVEPVLVQFGD